MAPESARCDSHSSPETSITGVGLSPKDIELRNKRARDRKSQQAMRDRNKWTIQNLTEQIAFLTRSMEGRSNDVDLLQTRIVALEDENAQLRAQNAALQLSMMGRGVSRVIASPVALEAQQSEEPWSILPMNTAPTCIADRILQSCVTTLRADVASSCLKTGSSALHRKPNLIPLLQKDHRTKDDISNLVGDVVRSYTEIDSLPRQVAVFYIMVILLKWEILLDEESWMNLPTWFRPLPCQTELPHAAWVDRIPWPRAREWLTKHPEITLDDWASPYSSSFEIKWDYDPAHVLISTSIKDPDSNDATCQITNATINPIFEEHIRKLHNWRIGDIFRNRFPELSLLIDLDTSPSREH